jgi:Domain of unknown function (DUF4387)
VPEHATMLDAIAVQIRSKNAGPFWMTLDVSFTSDEEYRWALDSGVMSPVVIGDLYQVDPARVRIFELANLHVIKVSFPRNVVAGSFDDRDLHAGQQHVLLAGLTVPVRSAPPGAVITEGGNVE